MKTILLLLILFPCVSFAQKWVFDGVYTLPEIKDTKVRLKAWDTIREAFTFTADSFKYSYAVMRPNGRVAVSVDYEEYGTWKIYKDTTLSAPDKNTGKEYPFERMYAVLDDGRIYGYFELSSAAYNNFASDPNATLSFIRNNKIFTFSVPLRHPLKK